VWAGNKKGVVFEYEKLNELSRVIVNYDNQNIGCPGASGTFS
jgi:hypothetical protein